MAWLLIDHFQSYTYVVKLSTWNKTGNVLAQNGLTEDGACQVTRQLVSFAPVVGEAAFTSLRTHSSSIYQLDNALTPLKHMTNAWTHLIIHAYVFRSSRKWFFSNDWSSKRRILEPKDNETFAKHVNLLRVKDLGVTIQDVPDSSIWTLPHFLETKLLHASFIWHSYLKSVSNQIQPATPYSQRLIQDARFVHMNRN